MDSVDAGRKEGGNKLSSSVMNRRNERARGVGIAQQLQPAFWLLSESIRIGSG